MSAQRNIDWSAVRTRLEEQQTLLERRLNVDPERLRAVYRQRASELAARREVSARVDEAWPALVFKLDGERFCLPLTALAEVLQFAGLSPVPGAPPELLGVINIRGEIRSVLDLARLLKIPTASEQSSGYIVLVRHDGVEVGLRVDEVEKIESVTTAACTTIGDEGDSSAIRRIRTPGRAIVLSVEEILTPLIHPHDERKHL